MDHLTPLTQQQIGVPIELYISCYQLQNSSVLGGSIDANVAVSEREYGIAKFKKVGETETVKNNANPVFQGVITVNYCFEKMQELKFKVKQYEETRYGNVVTTIGQILGSPECKFEAEIHPKNSSDSKGKLIVKALPVRQSTTQITLKIIGREFELTQKINCCCQLLFNPILEVYKISDQGGQKLYSKIHTSDPSGTYSPDFEIFSISAQEACNSNMDQPIHFKFLNANDTERRLIGVVEKSVNEMKQEKMFKIKNQQEGELDIGLMIIQKMIISDKPQFTNYLREGWQINFEVIMDFTTGNGEQTSKDSLHSLDGKNQYEQAIADIGSVLEQYSHDKKFSVFGFGGTPKFLKLTKTEFLFPVNGSFSNPEVHGVNGILEAYKRNLSGIEFSDSCLRLATVTQMTKRIEKLMHQKTYTVFLVLINCPTENFLAMRYEFIQASKLPISIIFVGIGPGNFEEFKAFDSDEEILRDQWGNTAIRDFIQFVKFRSVKGQKEHAGHHNALAEKVLKEIPEQFVNYMQYREIYPSAKEV